MQYKVAILTDDIDNYQLFCSHRFSVLQLSSTVARRGSMMKFHQ